MSKYQVAVTDNAVQFLVTRANGKVEALPGDFAFVEPMAPEKAVDALKHEVSQRGNVTRAALSSLYTILQSPRMDGYKGQGDINADEGAKLPKEMKTALRDAESAYFAPMFKDTKKLDTFLTGIRDAGIYATVKGVCLKYFYFAGKLPALYDGEHPNPEKLLSVSAMQKLLANMQDDRQTKDDSIAGRILGLQAEWADKTDLSRADLVLIRANLLRFAEEVQQSINVMDAEKTAKTENMLPPGAAIPAPVEIDAATIMEAWAQKEAAEQAAADAANDEEALF